MEDIRESLEELRYYRKAIFKDPDAEHQPRQTSLHLPKQALQASRRKR